MKRNFLTGCKVSGVSKDFSCGYKRLNVESTSEVNWNVNGTKYSRADEINFLKAVFYTFVDSTFEYFFSNDHACILQLSYLQIVLAKKKIWLKTVRISFLLVTWRQKIKMSLKSFGWVWKINQAFESAPC